MNRSSFFFVSQRFRGFAVAVFFLCLSGAVTIVSAETLSPLEGLELLRRGFAGMTDFTADITQEKQLSIMKKKLTSSGRVRFRRPGTFFMEILAPYPSRLLLENSDVTIYYPAEKNRQKIPLPAEEGPGKWFAYLDKPITTLPEGVQMRAERHGENCTLRIMPQGKQGIKELSLLFMDDGRIKKLIIQEQNGDRNSITFRNMKKNVGLTDKEFRLE
jgi:outer membrane lipoprotein carrier protein